MRTAKSISRSRTIVLIGALAFASTAAAAYHVAKRISIPGDGGWDYLTADTAARRLYVPHSTEVVVLDLDSGTTIGKVTGLAGVHGVAVAPEFGRGFVDATDPGSVTIFDLKTFAVIDKVRVGDDPNGIIYDAKLKRVFTADRGSKRLTAIDAKSGKIAGAIDLSAGRTEHLASDGAGHVFLNMQDLGKMHKLDVQAFKILETWDLLPTCVQPSSMDIDIAHSRIFVGCRGGAATAGQAAAPSVLAVVDAGNGKIVTTQPIGPGVDALEYDAAKGLIYVSTGGGDGALCIFHEDAPDKYSAVETVKTLPGARTMALDHKTGTAYLPVADFGPTPAATIQNLRPRPQILPGTFSVLAVGQ